MDSSERFAGDEALQGFMTESELAKGEIALGAEAALAQSDEIFRRIVFGAIDDAEIFLAAHLQSGLDESFATACDELARLDHDAFAAINNAHNFPPDFPSPEIATALLATLIAIAYADRYGRKFLLKTGLTGMIIALGGCGFLFYTGHTQGWPLLVLMLAYITCFAFSIGPVTWIIINEIFPTHVRARAVMVCTLALWGAVWLVGQFFPWLLVRVGAAFTFWAFAVFSAINLVFSLTIVRETKGKTLEEMDTAFAAPH